MKFHPAPHVRSSSCGGVAKKLLVLLCSTALVLLAVEWGVGRFFPVGGQIYVPDADLLFDAVPGSSRIHVVPEERVGEGDAARVLIRIGPDGFRGSGLEVPKRRKRVLVVGDSFVIAETAPRQSTFVHALEMELNRRVAVEGQTAGDSIETVNAGRSGYGPDQELLLLQRELERVDPDLVVCVLCAHNDFGDLMRNKLFYLGQGGVLERTAPVLGTRMQKWFSDIKAPSEQPALLRLWRFWQNTRNARAPAQSWGAGIMNTYVRALSAEAREHVVDRNPEVLSLFQDIYDIDVAAALPGSFAKAKVELMTAVLARMTSFTTDHDVPIAFVVVPSAVDLCEDFGVEVDPAQFPTYKKTALVDALVAAASAGGSLTIDVTLALTEDGPADRYFLGGTDIHWNAVGQAASASYVAEVLLRDPAAGSALGSTETPGGDR